MSERAIEAALTAQFNSRLRGPNGEVSFFYTEISTLAREIAAALAAAEQSASVVAATEALAVATHESRQRTRVAGEDATTEAEIVDGQLAEGNMGAQGYFMRRVDLFLIEQSPPRHEALARFLQRYWPAFKAGLKLKAALALSPGKDEEQLR